MPSITTERESWDIANSGGPATASLDATVDYLRVRGLRLLPCYIAGMLPASVIVVFLIDAISAMHRSAITTLCLALVPAALWRWAFLAKMQQLVQQDIQSRPGLSFWRRLPWILLLRLYSNVLMTWGSFTIIGNFFGLYLGSFAAPLLLERDGPALRESMQALTWIRYSIGRLLRAMTSFFILSLGLLVATFVVQYFVVSMLLPSLFGIDSGSVALTFQSSAWILSMFYFVAMLLDFFWTVASVFLYHDSQSRRTGADLRARLGHLASSEARRAA